jgi:hypothetical protein
MQSNYIRLSQFIRYRFQSHFRSFSVSISIRFFVHWILDTGSWPLVTGHWILVTGSWSLATDHSPPATVSARTLRNKPAGALL